jgi:hypothetical protein
MAVMRTPGLLLAVLAVAALAACSSPFSSKLSYAQMQSLNPGVPAGWVLSEWPFGQVTKSQAGTIEAISYTVEDPQGKSRSLRLEFDPQEILRRKVYSGPIVRPGGSHSQPVNR